MTIAQIKKALYDYRDFYGQDIVQTDLIEKGATKKELAEVLEQHRHFLEDQAIDAQTHLETFRRKIGISQY